MHSDANKSGSSNDPGGAAGNSKSWLFWLCVAIGSTAGVALLLCCGLGAWLARFGITQSEFEIESQLRNHPEIVARIGPLQSLSANLAKSTQDDAGQQIWTYDVQGSDGQAELIVDSRYVASEDREVIRSATLKLPSGEEISLDMPAPGT